MLVLDACNVIFHQGVTCCCCVPAHPQVSAVTKGVKGEAWELSKCSKCTIGSGKILLQPVDFLFSLCRSGV